MLRLDEKTWEEFPLESVFTVSAGKRLETRNKVDGSRPFIGATDNGNGITGFVSNDNASKDRNVLGVNYNGAPCIAFYHPYECIFTDDVKRLHLKDWTDSENSLLSFSPIFAMQRPKYSYGYKFKEQRMLRQKLMLPVIDDGEPDYEYMEQYASEKRGGLLMRYKNYVAERLSELEHKDIPTLDEKEWAGFEVGKLFKTTVRGKKTYMPTGALVDGRILNDGEIPRIRVTAANNGINGITNRANDSNFRTYKNFVSMSFLGSSFYHPYEASLDMKVHCLQFCDREMTAGLGLFVAVMLMQNVTGTNYGNQLSSEDLVSKRVLLPVNDLGEPDFDYMEAFGTNMMLRKYQQYLAFLDTKK